MPQAENEMELTLAFDRIAVARANDYSIE